jgi:hypothetical protein
MVDCRITDGQNIQFWISPGSRHLVKAGMDPLISQIASSNLQFMPAQSGSFIAYELPKNSLGPRRCDG